MQGSIAPPALSLLKGTSRVSPDKAVSVLNLAKAIEKVMKARGTRNILVILRPFCFATWKIAPAETVAGLVSISDLIFEMLALCPNTQLPRNKLKKKLIQLHEEDPIIFTARDHINFCAARDHIKFCAEMGALLRKAMGKLRVVRQKPLMYERAVSKVRI